MSVIRIIYASFPADQAERAASNWKQTCAPLMIQQDGCISEELLRCIDDPGEMISFSEWEDMASVEKYLGSQDHQEIKRHNRNIEGAQVVVKHYETVG